MKALALVAGLLIAFRAGACGVCVEDKIAACYDHAVVSAARSQGREVAFFAVQGAAPQDAPLRAKLARLLDATPGVARGSARVSLENGALSFAYDPKRSSAIAISDALEKRTGLAFGLLKIIDSGN